MGSLARWRTLAVGLAVAAFSVVPPASAGTEITDAEAAALEAGRPVVREENFERAGHRYIGGVSYILIDASPGQVTAALDDVRTYRQILPNTRSVRLIGLTRRERVVEPNRHAIAAAGTRYGCGANRGLGELGRPSALPDPRFPHDLVDANGFSTLEPGGQDALTHLWRVDLGPAPGLRGKVAGSPTPMLVGIYVEAHRPPV
jgi:hypothetical protein